jgi:hypothetical protein
LCFVFSVFSGCSHIEKNSDLEDSTENATSVELDDITSLLIQTRYRTEIEPILSENYLIEDGKVISVEFTNFNSPENNSSSSFEYDEEGRILSTFIDGERSHNVVWADGSADVYNAFGEVFASFTFDDDRILTYDQMGCVSKYNYDDDGRISISDLL